MPMPRDPGSGAIRPSHTHPVRAVDDEERERLGAARARGAFVAWRDAPGTLRVHDLRPAVPVTIGRAQDNTVAFEHVLVSRRHAEILLRVNSRPASTSVLLSDEQSKHGTAHRRLALGDEDRAARALEPAPTRSAGALRLAAGDHDVRLAGEVWLRVGAVPVDTAATGSREHGVAEPTTREHQVLVELCRPRFAAGRRRGPTPSNGQIAAALTPPIRADRVSDLLSQMYKKYGLDGTKEQNRSELVELALERGLVGHEHYT